MKITHSRAIPAIRGRERRWRVAHTRDLPSTHLDSAATARADKPHNLASNPHSRPVPAPRKDAAYRLAPLTRKTPLGGGVSLKVLFVGPVDAEPTSYKIH